MKLRTLACACLLALVSTTAAAQEPGGYYASLKAIGTLSNLDISLEGESTPVTLYDDAPEIVGGPSLAFGYRMRRLPIRLEAEWQWRYRFDMDAYTQEASQRVFKSNLGTHAFYWNAYYDVALTERLFAKDTAFGYVGGGLGVAFNTSEATAGRSGGVSQSVTNTETDFTWMLTLGMRYHITKRWILDVSYRFTDLGGMDTGETAFGRVTSDNYLSHDLLIGVAYGF